MSKVSIASIVVALGLCSGGPALAAQADDDKAWAAAQIGEDSGSFHLSQQPWSSTRTSTEGNQEVPAPRRTSEAHVLHGEDSGSFHLSQQPWSSTRTRAEVRQELLAAQRSGEANALCGEDSGSFHLSRVTGDGPVPYAGPERGFDTAPRAALTGGPARAWRIVSGAAPRFF